MAKEVRNTVRLGIFVTVGIVLFTVGIYYIGNRKNLFGERYRLETYVPNAHGLKVGNNVRYAGIVVGSIETIQLLNDTTLRVVMVLDGQVKGHIRKDAIASIGMDGLVGNVILNISPGNGNELPAEDGDVLTSFSRIDPTEMLNTLGNTNDNLSLLSNKLLEIAKKLNDGQGTIPLLLRDSTMAIAFGSSLDNLQAASGDLRLLIADLRDIVAGVSEGEGTLGYLLTDQALPQKLEAFTDHLDSLLVDEFGPVIAELQRTGEEVARSGEELRSAMEDLNRGEGVAEVLLRDSTAAADLKAILENLEEGTASFNENMEAMKHNFLFRRYFKKQAKEEEKAEN
ncbi:MAG: MCE family protein [Saprospiraceae bacterium]|nr:MCE family protein [Saprospiraceae bacterium]